jgi:NAD(P)-dependent dehydrogenase (short-subunit alcohol dehydrogenase family)
MSSHRARSGRCCSHPAGPDAKGRHFGEDSDFGRPGQPVELVPVYVFLASGEASFINGEVYGATGGKVVA